ncbi:MAG: hypothetical protein Q9183_007893 [Haloplaca sp. 2 TL-2023]
MRVIEKTKRRQRHVKTVRSKMRFTILRITEVNVKVPGEGQEEEEEEAAAVQVRKVKVAGRAKASREIDLDWEETAVAIPRTTLPPMAKEPKEEELLETEGEEAAVEVRRTTSPPIVKDPREEELVETEAEEEVQGEKKIEVQATNQAEAAGDAGKGDIAAEVKVPLEGIKVKVPRWKEAEDERRVDADIPLRKT